ncbi:hypothetical protein HK100_001489 [Physocladia obscura]|uniref:P-loop containing nucleoside triphosphate hydrolase protein n=1 Tax=Physocladia obscura TaxID=109957 RepID=A0AAD5XEU4_9FUNG|nr:hypothetical protein HK100_001489 [Physocladia obscura]
MNLDVIFAINNRTWVIKANHAKIESVPPPGNIAGGQCEYFFVRDNTIFQFSGLYPLFKYGLKTPLSIEDLYPLAPRYQAAELVDRFEKLWKLRLREFKQAIINNDAQKKSKPTEPSSVGILIEMFGRGFFPLGIMKFTSDMCGCGAPLLLQVIIAYIKNSTGISPPAHYLGFMYAIALFVVNMTSSTCIQFFFSRAAAYGMSVRAALTGAIFRKSLRLSGASRQKFNSGHITNIISTDLIRTELFILLFHLQWTFPVQIIVIVALLIHIIGVSALAGVALIISLVPFQIWVIKLLVSLRRNNAKTTDQRIKLTSETLAAIRVIKFFAWEDSFLERIFRIRDDELKAVISASIVRGLITASGFAIPVLAAVVTFIVYSVTSPVFDPTVIFTALALFNLLRNPLNWTPQMISAWADTRVALGRIHALLMSEENDFEPVVDYTADYGVVVEHGEFMWDVSEQKNVTESKFVIADAAVGNVVVSGVAESDKIALKGVHLKIPKGKLVAIVGSVGSGKSSLLSALVGQLRPVNQNAKVVFSGSVGLAAQVPWIMNATLKENILFGLPFNQKRYDKAIEVCSLRHDIEVLTGGDMAEIGEKGINLSGGQKQRVSLARLVYCDSSIVLLDDVLSAVDAHVGKAIFNDCIAGALKGKTRLLVTHQLHFVPQCDIVITMKNGEISEYGTYAELMAAEGEFSKLMHSYGGVTDTETESEDSVHEAAGKVIDIVVSEKFKRGNETSNIEQNDGKKLVVAEDREIGSVKSSVFLSFAVAMGGFKSVGLLIFVLVLSQAFRIATDLWLVYWTDFSISGLSNHAYLGVYFGLGFFQSSAIVIFSLLIALAGTTAAKTLHREALQRIAHTPSSFFDTNPLGRVLNRFSRDQDVIDNTLPDAVRLFFISFGMAVSTFCLVAYATSGWFLIVLVPLMCAYYYVQALYRNSARELKRLDSLTRSPLYSHITESMTGVNTIKAYGEQNRFIKKTDDLINANNSPYYLQQIGSRWLGMRLEYIGNVLVFATSIFGVASRSTIDPSLIGLALSYALQTTQLLQLCIRQYTDSEVQLVSIERLHYYATKVDTEAAGVIESNRPAADWPNAGIVEFKNVSMRYQLGLPLVLNGISLKTKKHEKIGVVGRTGSGKSSLMLSIFRIIEIESGEIIIDGIPTKSIGLKDLRLRLSIIPQDPVLFSGSVRLNLDPFNEHSDHDVWLALESSGLKKAIQDMEGGLDAPIDAGGENMSVGQRQLMCLARAILRKASVVILDECTANVDLKTDYQIQRTLREKMKDATIFTIAHRLNTVIDSDRILVLDGGKVAEFDSPLNLLSRDGRDGKSISIFAAMIGETGAQNAAALKELAKFK